MTDEPEPEATGATTRRRPRPSLAALLNFVLPGLGHFYASFHRRAALAFILFPALELAVWMLILFVPGPPANVLIPVALNLGLRAFLGVAAAADTRRGAAEGTVGRPNRWYANLTAAALAVAVINPTWARAYRATLLQAFRIPTGAMADTILRGDHLVVVKWAYGWRSPLLKGVVLGERPAERGDLVVFRAPEDSSVSMLKRVIGLPGEEIEIRQKQVYINGRPLEEDYVRFLEMSLDEDLSPRESRSRRALRADSLNRSADDWGPAALPEQSYFVLGDNRDNSRDSRFWGFVRQEDLLGRARVVYWSLDPETGHIRWSRIGYRLH